MRCIKAFVLSIMLLCAPSLVWAEGVLTPAANPPEPITILSLSAIPFIKASSGTMGNNGAISGMTPLPRIFSGGAYLYLPAGAIAAGVPAAATWYWFVGSSTTAGTVYNSTYVSGTPRAGTLTPFSTTGPGAYTGLTTSPVAVRITVPANLMGINGQVQVDAAHTFNNTAGNKLFQIFFGSGTCWAQTLTTQVSSNVYCQAGNRGVANRQMLSYQYANSSGSGTGAVNATDGSETTTQNVDVTFVINTAAATDHNILESYRVMVVHRD